MALKHFALVSFFALAACTTSAISLRNPSTGQTAKCGPYLLDGLGSNSQALRESKCVDDYQRQGFVRAP